MEEFIGKLWHRYITQSATRTYPEAGVNLDEVRKSAAIIFRAFGGEASLSVKAAVESQNRARRSLAQRVAGIGKVNAYAWRDFDSLYLPEMIALFDSKHLNRDLYIWLAAISAQSVQQKYWLASNQQRTLKTLQTWPGMKARYFRLVEAHIINRPDPKTLPNAEAEQERIIRAALRSPDVPLEFERAAKRAPQAVPLWLHPAPLNVTEPQTAAQQSDPDQVESKAPQPPKKPVKRKQGRRTDMPDEKDGLMSFRLESLWSWAEYIKVDRSGLDDDDDASRVAEDMDSISVSRDAKTATNKIKLDLDLPSEGYDDIVLGEGVPMDEWNYKTRAMQKEHCRIQPMVVRNAGDKSLPDALKLAARKVRQQFEMLRPQRQWVRRQTEGTELDLECFIDYMSERKRGRVDSDMPIYRELKKQHRDLSCLLLADFSLSTEAYISNDKQVIDVVRDSLFLFSEALDVTGDRFAVHGFSSRNRGHVRFYNIKEFSDAYDDVSRSRINAIKPGYYTRMGAAIRYATTLLAKESSSQKLLLLLSDGKPNDIDKYEGRYGVEDTRKAVLEAEAKGIRPFSITIDHEAEDYLPYLFGRQSYLVIRNAKALPRKLPALYLRLTC